MAAPRGRMAGRLEGFQATMQLFDKYIKNIDDFADVEMRDYAERIRNRSNYYCPVSDENERPPTVFSGYLRSSGQVEQMAPAHYAIVYTAWYAVYVHEVPGRRHKSPTQWKFLELAVKETVAELSAGNARIRFGSFEQGEGGTFQMISEFQPHRLAPSWVGQRGKGI